MDKVLLDPYCEPTRSGQKLCLPLALLQGWIIVWGISDGGGVGMVLVQSSILITI